MINIFSKDSLRKQIELVSNGKLTVLYDKKGLPSFMYKIERFNTSMNVFPAFVVDGVVKDEIFVGQFESCAINGGVYSLPNKEPITGLTYTQAKTICSEKNSDVSSSGWHMLTNWEWMAIMTHLATLNKEVLGNTVDSPDNPNNDGINNGVIIPNKAPYIYTGSGKRTFRSDHSIFGISDIVGNYSEMVDLIKIVNAKLFICDDNNYLSTHDTWTDTGLYMSIWGGPHFLDWSASPPSNTGSSNGEYGFSNPTGFDNILINDILSSSPYLTGSSWAANRGTGTFMVHRGGSTSVNWDPYNSPLNFRANIPFNSAASASTFRLAYIS